MPLRRERAEVKRVIVDRQIDAAPRVRREGDTLILPIVEEVAVVQKQLVLKEEIHITRRTTTEQHQETVTLRNEEPVIERLDAHGDTVETAVQPERERSILDPSRVRPSILKAPVRAQPVRRNKVLPDA